MSGISIQNKLLLITNKLEVTLVQSEKCKHLYSG